jgi:peptide/nickel transport system substrate-binding protein
MTTRRCSRRVFLATALFAASSRALDRVPYGGTLRLSLPLSLDGIDPHATGDPASALFADAVADSLYAWDSSGRPYPTLAEAWPEAVDGGARVTLRPGLQTGLPRPLKAEDVLASLERSRRGAGAPLLAGLRAVRAGETAVFFPRTSPAALVEVLASPVTAIVPQNFDPRTPEATGAFRVKETGARLLLERNARAARGPAFIERLDVARAADLADALRAFEAGDVDVGWLGAGLHRRRAGAVDFRSAPRGFVVLRTGTEAGTWGAPGVAQRLVESLDPRRVSYLGLSPKGGADTTLWGGAPADLLVDQRSPYFVELARVVAAALSSKGHEIRPAPVPASELRTRVAERRFALALDFVRGIGRTPYHLLQSLLAAVDPKLAEKPPRFSSFDPAQVARTLPLGVLGEFAPVGAHLPGVQGLEAWDLGNAWIARSPP